MYLTVQEMIEQGGFSDFIVLAGESGLKTREVKTICVVDTPDVEGWIFGGEFLLSSGFIFQKNPDLLTALVETASRAGAAGLGVKTDRYIERIPPEVLRVADKLSFPLIGIPRHYAHTDIINPALVTIANKKAQLLDQKDELWRAFFDCLLSDSSADAILALLKKEVGKDALYVNTITGRRHIAADTPEFNQVAEEVPLASLSDLFPCLPVTLDGKTCGYLLLERDISAPHAADAVEHARRALQLYMKWEAERWRIERGHGEMFVQDILFKRFRHDTEIQSRGRTLGWELGGLHAVVLIEVDKERSAQREPGEPHISAYEIFHTMLRKLQPAIPHALLEDSMAFIIKAPENEWPGIKKELEEIFIAAKRLARAKTGLHLLMGVGSPVESMLSCDKSFWEAKRTLSLSRTSDNTQAPLFWEEMGVYKLLAPLLGSQDAADFVSEQLGPLLRHVRAHQQDDSLIHTLACIIRNNWQLKPVAGEMNLHYNTVKYRCRKIEDLLGQDLESHETRMNLSIAMELFMLSKPETREKESHQ